MNNTLMRMMIVAGLLTSAGAQAVVIDGNLADWGVDAGIHSAGNVSDWTPNPGVHYTVEDQHGNSRLDAGWGGQAYDAEALYVSLDAGTLYIALATGHKPGTRQGGGSYGAGDFAIDFGRDGSYELGINIKPAWDAFGVSGGVYKTSGNDWSYGIWNDNAIPGFIKSEHPTSLKGGQNIGAVTALAIDSVGQRNIGEWSGDTHYFYEMALSSQLLADAGWQGESFNVHWTMNCANDTILADPPSATSVPEPGTLALLPLGMAGLFALRRRKSA